MAKAGDKSTSKVWVERRGRWLYWDRGRWKTAPEGVSPDAKTSAPADKPAPRKRHAPKSAPAIAVLKSLYPPDGRPSRADVPDSKLERDYNAACDKLGIHRNDRAKKSQLLRCVGRKK